MRPIWYLVLCAKKTFSLIIVRITENKIKVLISNFVHQTHHICKIRQKPQIFKIPPFFARRWFPNSPSFSQFAEFVCCCTEFHFVSISNSRLRSPLCRQWMIARETFPQLDIRTVNSAHFDPWIPLQLAGWQCWFFPLSNGNNRARICQWN